MTLASLVIAEIILRSSLDYPLSGSWRVYDERGLHLNKSKGTATHNAAGYSAVYHFHYPHLRGKPSNKGKFRILILGDSYSFGWLLNWEDTFVGQLERLIHKRFGENIFEIANASAGGWGLDSYLAFLEGYGEQINPDIVLIFLNTGDVPRSLKNGLYRMEGEKLVAVKKPIPIMKRITQSLPFYESLISSSYLLQAMRRVYLLLRYGKTQQRIHLGPEIYDSQVSDTSQNLKTATLAKSIFEEILRWEERKNKKLIIATTAWHNPPYDDKSSNEIFMSQAEDFFTLRDTPYFDGSKHLADRKNINNPPIFIKNDGHPNVEGSRLIAQINWPFIENELLKFCQHKDCMPTK